jgi:hypothetical protein
MDGMTTSLAMEQAEEDLKDAPTVRQILRDLPSGEKPAVKPPKGDQQ